MAMRPGRRSVCGIGREVSRGGVITRCFRTPRTRIELNAAVEIPEWNGKKIRIMLEEDAFFDGEKTRYIDGRQTSLHLIPRRPHD